MLNVAFTPEVVEDMTLEGDKPSSVPVVEGAVALVGKPVEDDSDSDDDGPVVDIEDYQEEDDPVRSMIYKYLKGYPC